MRDPNAPKLPLWPFFIGDALLLGCAGTVLFLSARPLPLPALLVISGCVAGAALLGIAPFFLEYRAATNLTALDALASAMDSIRQVESVGAQIQSATGHWQNAQDEANKTASAAKGIAEHMTRELKDFTAFMERANNSEKANLRLEVEKLRRAEGEWVQVVVRMLDHIFALHQGAVKSGQQNVIQQVSRFQHACCDAARRVGLAPFVAAENEEFNPERHQPFESKTEPPPDAAVSETLASGYTYQGKVVRPALVRLHENGSAPPEETATPQAQLPLA